MLRVAARNIPLSAPHFFGNELRYLEEAIRTGWVSYAGQFVTRLERALASNFGFANSVVTCSGTTALQLALHICDLRGCEVLVPSLTFIAPLSAIVHAGAVPVLIDLDPSDWQMDLGLARSFLEKDCRRSGGRLFNNASNREVKAICAVHLLGSLADISALRDLAHEFELHLIEDAAEALGCKYHGQPIGAKRMPESQRLHLVASSLNANKVATAGGGGCLLTHNEDVVRRLRHLSGTAKCDAIEYHHDEAGFNYRMTNVSAAVGLGQLECLDRILAKRREIHQVYRKQLAGLPISFMPQSAHVQVNNWLTTIRLEGSSRPALSYLLDRGVQARPVWVPMNRLPMFVHAHFQTVSRVSDLIWENALSLPNGSALSIEEVEFVSDALHAFFRNADSR